MEGWSGGIVFRLGGWEGLFEMMIRELKMFCVRAFLGWGYISCFGLKGCDEGEVCYGWIL